MSFPELTKLDQVKLDIALAVGKELAGCMRVKEAFVAGGLLRDIFNQGGTSIAGDIDFFFKGYSLSEESDMFATLLKLKTTKDTIECNSDYKVQHITLDDEGTDYEGADWRQCKIAVSILCDGVQFPIILNFISVPSSCDDVISCINKFPCTLSRIGFDLTSGKLYKSCNYRTAAEHKRLLFTSDCSESYRQKMITKYPDWKVVVE